MMIYIKRRTLSYMIRDELLEANKQNRWEKVYTKVPGGMVEPQPALPVAIPIIEFQLTIDGLEQAIEIFVCPQCHGVMGVDWTYLDQVTEIIRCPMCEKDICVEDPQDFIEIFKVGGDT
jgi:Zn-finger nucleic acid-binding protein